MLDKIQAHSNGVSHQKMSPFKKLWYFQVNLLQKWQSFDNIFAKKETLNNIIVIKWSIIKNPYHIQAHI